MRKTAGQCLISFDRWNSSTLVTELTGDGVLVAPIGMGYASQSAPLRELERFTLEKSWQHHAGQSQEQDKIDGVMSLNCAVAEWMTRTAADPNEIPDDYMIRTL